MIVSQQNLTSYLLQAPVAKREFESVEAVTIQDLQEILEREWKTTWNEIAQGSICPTLQETLDFFQWHPLYAILWSEGLFASYYGVWYKKIRENYACSPRLQGMLSGTYGDQEQITVFLKTLFTQENSSFNTFVTSDETRLKILLDHVIPDKSGEFFNLRNNDAHFKVEILGAMDLIYGTTMYDDEEFESLVTKI